MSLRPNVTRIAILALCLAASSAAASVAHACPVCFGNDSSPLSQGARAAAGVLMGFTSVVLGGVGGLAIRLYRRRRVMAAHVTPAPVAAVRAESEHRK